MVSFVLQPLIRCLTFFISVVISIPHPLLLPHTPILLWLSHLLFQLLFHRRLLSSSHSRLSYPFPPLCSSLLLPFISPRPTWQPCLINKSQASLLWHPIVAPLLDLPACLAKLPAHQSPQQMLVLKCNDRDCCGGAHHLVRTAKAYEELNSASSRCTSQ